MVCFNHIRPINSLGSRSGRTVPRDYNPADYVPSTRHGGSEDPRRMGDHKAVMGMIFFWDIQDIFDIF